MGGSALTLSGRFWCWARFGADVLLLSTDGSGGEEVFSGTSGCGAGGFCMVSPLGECVLIGVETLDVFLELFLVNSGEAVESSHSASSSSSSSELSPRSNTPCFCCSSCFAFCVGAAPSLFNAPRDKLRLRPVRVVVDLFFLKLRFPCDLFFGNTTCELFLFKLGSMPALGLAEGVVVPDLDLLWLRPSP